MDITLKLFIVGAISGLIIALVPFPGDIQYDNDPEKYFKQVFSAGANVWKTVYFLILLVSMPFMVIEPLKKRFSMKQLLPLPFIAGNSLVFVIITLISIFLTFVS